MFRLKFPKFKWANKPTAWDKTVPLPPEVAGLRQGDVLQIFTLPVMSGVISKVSCPHGVAIVTQTCDAVRDSLLELQVCPVVQLESPDRNNALSGRQPRYCALPNLGGEFFVDLSVVATIHKRLALEAERVCGVDQQEQHHRDKFAHSIARRFNRFAFPDEVVPWIKPLQDLFRSKVPNSSSALSEVVRHIEELRLESVGGWRSDGPFDLVLILIVRAGTLPDASEFVEVDLDGMPTKSPSQVAMDFPSEGSSKQEIVIFWETFGSSIEKICHPPKNSSIAVQQAVRSLTVETISEEDLTYQRVRRSAELDLDHLSEPGPS